MMRELRMALRILRGASRALAWTLATLWLGARLLLRWARVLDRSHLVLAQTARCPRGHRVPLFATFQCSSCRAVLEGYVFRPCKFCGSVPFFTPCRRCGLGVRNPLHP